jgi:hypothetical protein
LELQLEIGARKLQVAIEKSNLKLLEAVSARSLSFRKGSGDEEQAEMNKDNPKNSDLGSDTTPNLDPKLKG